MAPWRLWRSCAPEKSFSRLQIQSCKRMTASLSSAQTKHAPRLLNISRLYSPRIQERRHHQRIPRRQRRSNKTPLFSTRAGHTFLFRRHDSDGLAVIALSDINSATQKSRVALRTVRHTWQASRPMIRICPRSRKRVLLGILSQAKVSVYVLTETRYPLRGFLSDPKVL